MDQNSTECFVGRISATEDNISRVFEGRESQAPSTTTLGDVEVPVLINREEVSNSNAKSHDERAGYGMVSVPLYTSALLQLNVAVLALDNMVQQPEKVRVSSWSTCRPSRPKRGKCLDASNHSACKAIAAPTLAPPDPDFCKVEIKRKASIRRHCVQTQGNAVHLGAPWENLNQLKDFRPRRIKRRSMKRFLWLAIALVCPVLLTSTSSASAP
jgi:hypothetical protein